MSLTIKAFDAGNVENISGQNAERMAAKGEQKSIFGGNLNLANDPIEQRRKEAQEKAWNIVKNAWDNDCAVDGMIEARRNHYAQMQALKEEATAGLSDIEEEKEVLRELYDVDEDSREQKDLELLEKAQDIQSGVSKETLTAEERKRVAELYQGALTEYQSRGLELNERAIDRKKQIADVDKQMRDDIADIHSIKQERLKSNPMLEAQKAAEEILDAANDEVIGMLIQESQEYIDEKMAEEKEDAEKSMEEKEEREEQLDELKLKRAVQEALIEGTKEAVEKAKAMERRMESPEVEISEMIDIAQGDSAATDVGQSLDEIKNSMNLLEADLKGIKVDKEV